MLYGTRSTGRSFHHCQGNLSFSDVFQKKFQVTFIGYNNAIREGSGGTATNPTGFCFAVSDVFFPQRKVYVS